MFVTMSAWLFQIVPSLPIYNVWIPDFHDEKVEPRISRFFSQKFCLLFQISRINSKQPMNIPIFKWFFFTRKNFQKRNKDKADGNPDFWWTKKWPVRLYGCGGGHIDLEDLFGFQSLNGMPLSATFTCRCLLCNFLSDRSDAAFFPSRGSMLAIVTAQFSTKSWSLT